MKNPKKFKNLKQNFFSKISVFLLFIFFLNFIFVNSQTANYIKCLDELGNVSDEVLNESECPAGTLPSFEENGDTINTDLPDGYTGEIDTKTSKTEIPTTEKSVDIGQSKYELLYGGVNLDKLVNGPYNSLDPKDYQYCVFLTKDLALKSTDKDSNNEVTALQNYLTDRGFLESNATGYFGRWTEVAVLRFQNKNQLLLSGIADEETRNLIKELTCAKYPKVTYVDKPVSPSPIVYKKPIPKLNVSNSPKKSTTIPTTLIPNTNLLLEKNKNNENDYTSISTGSTISKDEASIPKSTNKILNLISPNFGNMYLSKKTNLYFTFNSPSDTPYICMNIDTDCNKSSDFNSVKEGLNSDFEAVRIGSKWVFTLYNTKNWGNPISKIKIFIKEDNSAKDFSVYNFSVLN